LLGIETSVSSVRLITASTSGADTAAVMPSSSPLPLASTAATSATPTV